MTHPSLVAQELTIRFVGHVVVNKVSCAFRPGELTVIVGPNGAGKTTYFNRISGQLRASEGRVLKDRIDLTRLSASARAHHGIGRAFHLTNLFPALSVLENIRLAVQAQSGHGWRVWGQARRFTELTARAERYLEATKLEKVAHLAAAALPHGDQRKLEVALLMAMEPDICMFDEPTAGMSRDAVPDVPEPISDLKQEPATTVVPVEHKMDVVRALADRIIVLHNGEFLVDGKPDEVRESDIVRDVYLGKSPDKPVDAA